MVIRKGINSTKNSRKGLMSLAGIGLLIMSMTAVPAWDEDTRVGKVLRVVDGDTLIMPGPSAPQGVYMRLAGIDAPETYNHKKAKKAIISCGVDKKHMFAYGRISKDYLIDAILHRDIKYTVVDIGRYRRPIIYIPQITENLVRSGLVAVVDYRNLPKAIFSKLRDLEEIAKQQKIGLWNHIDLSCMNRGI